MSAAAKRLEGKTVLITGASSGIGKSTAFEYARTAPNNLKLILTARRIDTLKEVAAEIQKEVGSGVKVHPVKLDVSNPEEVRQLVPNLPEEFKDIHILVNNAYVCYSFSIRLLTNTGSKAASSRELPRLPRSPRRTSTSCSQPTSPASST